MKGKDSLEEVLQEENTSASLPVVTVGDAKRVLYLDNYLGTRRIFIP
jgi:hypothetical protein